MRPPARTGCWTAVRSGECDAGESDDVIPSLTLSSEIGESAPSVAETGPPLVPTPFWPLPSLNDCDDAPPPVPVDRPGDESLDSPIQPRGATTRSTPFSIASALFVAPRNAYLYLTGRSSGATSKSSHHVRVASSRFMTGARSFSHPPSAAQSPVAVSRWPGSSRSVRTSRRTRMKSRDCGGSMASDARVPASASAAGVGVEGSGNASSARSTFLPDPSSSATSRKDSRAKRFSGCD